MSSKSTFSHSTSQSYALALYELAKENSIINKAEEEIKSLKKLINESQDFKEMILSPTITMENKKDVIFLIATNMCGTHHSKRKTYGHSLIVSPDGKVIKELKFRKLL